MKDSNIDKERLDSVETLEELAEIGIEVLKQMHSSGKTIVYVAGPISTGGEGNIDKNLVRLSKAIVIAKNHGLQIFDQVIFEGAMRRLSYKYPKINGYYVAPLDFFYKPIFESGFIGKALFLPDWQSSKGATWERNLAKALNIKVEEYPEDWLSEIKKD